MSHLSGGSWNWEIVESGGSCDDTVRQLDSLKKNEGILQGVWVKKETGLALCRLSDLVCIVFSSQAVGIQYFILMFSSKLIMLALDLDVKHNLMKVAVSPGFLQLLHLIVIQPSSHFFLELFPTNLGANLLGLVILVLGLEARLHTETKLGIRRNFVSIATDGRR